MYKKNQESKKNQEFKKNQEPKENQKDQRYQGYKKYCENVIAVSNRHLCKRPFLEQIKVVCEWHPKALILREKDLTEAEYEQLAGQVMKICEMYKVPCILHNFWQIAVKLNCNQIHLPLPVLRQLVNQAVIQEKSQGSKTFYQIGTSVHSVEEAVEAEKLGVSYLVAGHIYATDCKKGVPPRGIGFLKEVCDAVRLPVYGIGGIHFEPEQWKELAKAGAEGGCIMSGMMTLSEEEGKAE